MKTAQLLSSCLSAATHDPRSQFLEVEFRRGSIYRYAGVPERVFRMLVSAPSQGRYFNQYIRNHYPVCGRYKMLRAESLRSQ